jgi:hypothetical protein
MLILFYSDKTQSLGKSNKTAESVSQNATHKIFILFNRIFIVHFLVVSR